MLLLVVVVVSIGSAGAATRTESKPYIVGSDALATERDLGTGLSGACFSLVGDEKSGTTNRGPCIAGGETPGPRERST